MRRKPARSYLSSLYSRMSKAAQAGMRRLRSRANRAGPEHLAADAREFDYIEREARDILDAVARLRARDAAESSGVFEPELALAPETMPITEWAPDASAPGSASLWTAPSAPMLNYVEEPMPDTRATGNMVRGRRRNMAGLSAAEKMQHLRAAHWEARSAYENLARLESLTREERAEKERAYARLMKIEHAIHRMRSR